jgi:uncharacterized membrane protein YoaK (UPF0700 family)
MSFFDEIRQTIVPGRDSEHGPLPPLLVAMTFVTGLVDAFSYLVLGRVFVANMTGNVVLLGFALVGAPGFSVGASVVSMASFTVAALVGGRIGAHFARHRGNLLAAAATLQGAFVAAAVVLALLGGTPVANGYRYALIAVLAVAMGVQNAAARKLAVPDLTTTVLTLTLTGIAADSTIAGGHGSKAGRRLIAVAAMLAGAVTGAALVLYVQRVYPLAIALAVLLGVAATARALGRADSRWIRGVSPLALGTENRSRPS